MNLYGEMPLENGRAIFEYLAQFHPVMIFRFCAPTVIPEALKLWRKGIALFYLSLRQA